MDQNALMGAKELYDVVLKATYPIELGNRTLEVGEVILAFDNIQISGFQENKERITAHGGYGDRDLVYWETTKEVTFTFTQGVFSLEHLAMVSNSKLFELEKNNSVINITQREILESDENGEIQLKHLPVGKPFLYDKETGEKLEFEISNDIITINEPYKEVYVTYEYEYVEGGSVIKMGNRLFRGYISLEGKTRLKEDTSGQVVTGIFKIPKLRLMSDLSIRLGRQADPAVVTFRAVGVPVGGREKSYVCELYSLNDDIDSDM